MHSVRVCVCVCVCLFLSFSLVRTHTNPSLATLYSHHSYYGRKDVAALKRLMSIGKQRASKRDLQHLEDMTNYCTEREDCRRKVFMMQFGQESREHGIGAVFRRCNTMCDNCLGYIKQVRKEGDNKGPPLVTTTAGNSSSRTGFTSAASYNDSGVEGGDDDYGEWLTAPGAGAASGGGGMKRPRSEQAEEKPAKVKAKPKLQTAATLKRNTAKGGASATDSSIAVSGAAAGPFGGPFKPPIQSRLLAPAKSSSFSLSARTDQLGQTKQVVLASASSSASVNSHTRGGSGGGGSVTSNGTNASYNNGGAAREDDGEWMTAGSPDVIDLS